MANLKWPQQEFFAVYATGEMEVLLKNNSS